MAKTKTQFECSNCGYISPKWNGSCPSCNEWNTFVEKTVSKNKSSSNHKAKVEGLESTAEPKRLQDVETSEKTRFKSNISELDRVLGGGFYQGHMYSLGGNRGSEKVR